jgi:DNA-binding CsgD family transcriptional regulator
MRKYTIHDLVKTPAQREFVERLVTQAHANKRIRKILNITHETVDQTKRRIFKVDDKDKN